ncbi:hypothetical protein HZH68_004368 [Vespula germanica]|uniref:Uncharacterized protein n=1 Tax=Vespula germanica TaxID=30212 RepID=A0A834KNS7_VESGE|nr:hypothetical protein HZH68_004368 [Vespula germanica]
MEIRRLRLGEVVSRDYTGRDSPPEPAPPEVPPRGPSLHATHTLRTQQTRNGCPPNASGNFTVPTDQIPSETYSGEIQYSSSISSNTTSIRSNSSSSGSGSSSSSETT